MLENRQGRRKARALLVSQVSVIGGIGIGTVVTRVKLREEDNLLAEE